MPSEQLGPWLARSSAGHVADRVASGEDPEAARRAADGICARLFPGGVPVPGQCVFRVLDDGVPVGTLWIGVGPAGRPTEWYVWSIEIDEAARGRGVGRRAMLLGEEAARACGAVRIALNVFGSNAAARRLYESLSYEVTTLQMSKPL